MRETTVEILATVHWNPIPYHCRIIIVRSLYDAIYETPMECFLATEPEEYVRNNHWGRKIDVSMRYLP